MEELTKGMFGHEFTNEKPRFGISTGQMRHREMCHNSGWYNKKGEKLGWGDLTAGDMQIIMDELRDDELFIILPEQDSFWAFVTHHGMLGSLCKTKPEESAPGVDYVAEHARFVLAKGKAYYAGHSWENPGQRDLDGITVEEISRQDLVKLVKAA